jgi:hypothetical protein
MVYKIFNQMSFKYLNVVSMVELSMQLNLLIAGAALALNFLLILASNIKQISPIPIFMKF